MYMHIYLYTYICVHIISYTYIYIATAGIEVMDPEEDVIEITNLVDEMLWDSVEGVPNTPCNKYRESREDERGTRWRKLVTSARVCVQQTACKFPRLCVLKKKREKTWNGSANVALVHRLIVLLAGIAA